ncbi:MAG: chemotaxis protein CheC [Clostridiales Family XIII bacterium]|nr:chemotaxis protein CheC [Clostridiales Family XIII bacterium]
MISTYSDLGENHIDALREIGNIGAGNAASSLAVLLGEDVHIGVPQVRIEPYENVIRSLGGPEELGVAVLVDFLGEASGVVLFILSMQDANRILSIMAGTPDADEEALTDMKLSAIMEIGNILGSSYLGSVATLTGMQIRVDVPRVAIDMLGAILAEPIAAYGAGENQVMFIEESFSSARSDLHSHVILFTEMATLAEIMKRLGI